MNLDEMLCDVSIIGAAGKMGSGIATLVAQELARLKLKNPGTTYKANLIDVNEEGIDGLRNYLKGQATKVAEKSIVSLRAVYESRQDLVENHEVIDAFVDETLGVLNFGTDFGLAKNSNIVFEAIIENEELKVKVLKELKELCSKDTLFFTNTSSIPIGYLDKEVGLDGRIVGYHFYNPPVVQRLVEVITSSDTRADIKKLANEFGTRLGKKLVPANDVAGFIGNGHFIRDGLHAMSEVQKLSSEYSLPGSIHIMNRVSQDFLVRPMGIFQLIDYVGVDVFQCILRVMNKHLQDDSLQSDLVDRMMEKNVRGGQRADGSQKDGFLKYERNRPVGVFDLDKGEYAELEKLKSQFDSRIGDLPSGFCPWKSLIADPKKADTLSAYFNNLKSAPGLGTGLAQSYLARSKQVGKKLVEDGVANSEADVNAVLTNGFFWLYGPINDYV
jgi:3-hydroxyacyl-CoA dehydrogenase